MTRQTLSSREHRLLAVTAMPAATLFLGTTFTSPALAQTYSFSTVLNFQAGSPGSGLTSDAGGNLYGTIQNGGGNADGQVFKLTNTGTTAKPTYGNAVTTLVTFNSTNGGNLEGNLLLDGNGNLFGTANYAGANNDGTVYEITNSGTVGSPIYTAGITNLASFNGNSNGANPTAGLIADSSGNLYGTTSAGGANGDGTVFRLSNSGSASSPAYAGGITPVATFAGATNGATPEGALVRDSAGNLYGTTDSGGANNFGTVYKIAAGTNAFSTIATFNNSNGAFPTAALKIDVNGNLFGTTGGGGANGVGTLFEIANSGSASNPVFAGGVKTLNSFSSVQANDTNPTVTLDGNGNLYGTAISASSNSDGIVYELANSGTAANPIYSSAASTLYTFSGSQDGGDPRGDLTVGSDGSLYGTTVAGGSELYGTVFKLTPNIGGAASAPEPGALTLLLPTSFPFLLGFLHRRRTRR